MELSKKFKYTRTTNFIWAASSLSTYLTIHKTKPGM